MEINVDLSVKPSRPFLIKLLQGILLYLLHERAQIPFSFDVFERFLLNKSLEGNGIKCYKTLKQFKIAKETYEKICSFQHTIRNEYYFSRSVVIVFGNSLQTAKECYRINLPARTTINEEILPNYDNNETSMLRKVLLQIITNDQLKLGNQLPITNTFVLFNRHEPTTTENIDLSEIRSFKLNKACKSFILNLRDTSEFEIFQENFEDLTISGEKPPQQEETETDNWYQSKVFVKGFNDILVNNKSIWN